MDLFEVPFLGNEFRRQPIEQFGMRGQRALRAEIVFRLHEAASEILLPDAIDDDPGSERILRINDPAGQIKAGWEGGSLVGRLESMKNGRHAGRYGVSFASEI